MDDITAFEKGYKGSEEEAETMRSAYVDCEGDMERILEEVSAVPPTGGGGGGGANRGTLPRAAPSVRGPPNSAELVQILAVSMTIDNTVRTYCIIYGTTNGKFASERHKREAKIKQSKVTKNQQESETNPMSFKSACFAFIMLGRKLQIHILLYVTTAQSTS